MWDWRYPINDIRDEIRKARSEGESATTLDGMERLLDSLTSMYERLESNEVDSQHAQESQFHNFVQQQKEVIRSSYEHAKQYSNLVILGGYAGLFGIWNFTKDYLRDWQVLASGLFALISVFIFIAFELYSGWLRATQVKNQINELKEAEKLNRFPEEYGKGEMARADRFMTIWPFFFYSAVILALLATLILVYSFISGLICNYA